MFNGFLNESAKHLFCITKKHFDREILKKRGFIEGYVIFYFCKYIIFKSYLL